MRILVVHAWLKGNLGDVLQLSVLLAALRDLKPARLDLAGYPIPAGEGTEPLVAAVDRVIPDPFWWFWTFVPRPMASWLIEPQWRRARAALFAGYDAVVCAPGPYLASYDPRAVAALADLRIAAAQQTPIVLASHSIGPLPAADIADLNLATVRVAREAATHRYLAEHGCSSVASADYAFLYPYADIPAAGPGDPYTLVFLRADNLAGGSLRRQGSRLFAADRLLADGGGTRLVLATSDRRRDATFLEQIGRQLDVETASCRTVPEMVRLVAGSSAVVSDRYHPAICAAVLGKPVDVIPNREPHKMQGLTALLSGHSIADLQARARTGLEAVLGALRPIS